MKVAFLVTDITYRGGVERVVCNLINKIIKEGVEIDLVSFSQPYNDNINFILDDNVKIKYLNVDIEEKTNKLYKQFKFILAIKKHFCMEEYDYIVSTNVNFNIYLAILKNIMKSKIIGCEHGEYDHVSGGWRKLSKILYRRLDSIVLLTDEELDIYNKFSDKITVIPNGITNYPYKEAPLDNKKIISVGRLDENKNFKDSIEIFSMIEKNNYYWEFHIYGEGEEKNNLIDLIKELNLQDKVFIHKYSNDIYSKYMESSIFIMTSKTEGMPMVLLEAMSCGIPVLSYDIKTGPKFIIKDYEDGFIIPAFDKAEMASKLEALMNDNVMRKKMGKNARENVKRFSQENIIGMWMDLFRKL